MKRKKLFLFFIIAILFTLTGCQMSKEDLIKNTKSFNEYIFSEEYKTNQKAANEKYKNNKYLFFGYVDSVEDNYAIIKAQMYEYEVYFNDKDLLSLKNDYLIRFSGTFEKIDDGEIIVKKASYIDDNVDLWGKISVEDNWAKKGCYLESGNTSTLLKDIEYSWKGGYCLYNGKSLTNDEFVIVNGKIKVLLDDFGEFKEYKIENINSIEYEDSNKNKEEKDGMADGTKGAFKEFGITFDGFDVKYNYLSAEYVNGKNSYTNNPAPTLDIYVYIKDKLTEEERTKEYDKILNYLKSVSVDGKIYSKPARGVYEETSELKISKVGFTNYFKIGNGMYTVELYNNGGEGASINSTYYKEYYHLHFFNYDPQ